MGEGLSVDFGAPIQNAANEGINVLQDNVLYLFALPVAWTVFSVVKGIVKRVRG